MNRRSFTTMLAGICSALALPSAKAKESSSKKTPHPLSLCVYTGIHHHQHSSPTDIHQFANPNLIEFVVFLGVIPNDPDFYWCSRGAFIISIKASDIREAAPEELWRKNGRGYFAQIPTT